MSTTRLAIRGVALNWLARACAIVTAFIVTPILVVGLGDEGYGIWSIVMSFTTYYALADLGLRAAAIKYIAQFEAVKDRESVNKVITTSLAICALLALAVLLVVWCIAQVFPAVFNTSADSQETLRWVLMLSGASVSLAICGEAFGAALSAAKRFDLLNMVGIGTQILQAVLVVVAISNGGGLLALAWILLSVAGIRQLCNWLLAKRVLEHVSASPRFFEWKMARMLFRFGSLTLLQGMAKRVTKSSGALIVGVIIGPVAVTFYAIAQELANKAVELGDGIRGVLTPIASQLDAQNRQADLAKAFLLSARTLLALALGTAVGFRALGWPLIELWIGDGYASRVYPVLCVLAAAVVIEMPSIGTRSLLRGMNHVGFLAKVSLLGMVLTLGLGVVFVWTMGIVGMAGAILLSEAVTTGILIPVFACRTLDVSPGRFLRKVIAPGTIAACPGIVATLALVSLVPPSHIGHVIAQAVGVGLIVGTGIFFICFEKQLRTDVLRCFRRETRPAPNEERPVPDAARTSRDQVTVGWDSSSNKGVLADDS